LQVRLKLHSDTTEFFGSPLAVPRRRILARVAEEAMD
jgi:hypothetical protein